VMMNSTRKAFAFLLVAVMAITAQAALASERADHSSALAAPHEEMAPCHAHRVSHSSPPARRPEPVNYRCCMTGHSAVVPTAAYVSQPADACAHRTITSMIQAHLLCSTVASFPQSRSTSPPGTTLLRI